MTIDDLIPDKELNLGGRPQGSGSSDDSKFGGRTVTGRAFTKKSNSKEWWEETIKKCLSMDVVPYNDNERKKAILELAEYTYLFPIEVRTQLEKHGLYEFDWKEYLAHRPHLFGDVRLPENWREKTKGQHYSMKDTMLLNKGEKQPFYDQLENPEKHRTTFSKRSKSKSKSRDVPSDGAFSDLINDSS